MTTPSNLFKASQRRLKTCSNWEVRIIRCKSNRNLSIPTSRHQTLARRISEAKVSRRKIILQVSISCLQQSSSFKWFRAPVCWYFRSSFCRKKFLSIFNAIERGVPLNGGSPRRSNFTLKNKTKNVPTGGTAYFPKHQGDASRAFSSRSHAPLTSRRIKAGRSVIIHEERTHFQVSRAWNRRT